jgi:hypothetical protein
MPSIDRNRFRSLESEARWPGRLRALAVQWRAGGGGANRDAVLAEF